MNTEELIKLLEKERDDLIQRLTICFYERVDFVKEDGSLTHEEEIELTEMRARERCIEKILEHKERMISLLKTNNQ